MTKKVVIVTMCLLAALLLEGIFFAGIMGIW